MLQTRWTGENIADQTGKKILITGANSGLGFEATKVLSSKGAHIIMAVRNLEKGNQAISEIKKANPNANLNLMQIDLGNLSSIKSFSETFHKQYNSLHVLINNAGIMLPLKREITSDGFEIQFGTNHLGHFALTALMLDVIKKTPRAVIVTQSSIMHKIRGARIRFEDLNWENSYNNWQAYAQSKLANLLFSYHLDKLLKANNIDAIAVASHPGYTATNLQRTSGFLMIQIWNHLIAQKVDIGALPMLRAATDKELKGGEYIGPTRLMEMRGFPELVKSSIQSYNVQLAIKLWDVSEKLTGIRYSF